MSSLDGRLPNLADNTPFPHSLITNSPTVGSDVDRATELGRALLNSQCRTLHHHHCSGRSSVGCVVSSIMAMMLVIHSRNFMCLHVARCPLTPVSQPLKPRLEGDSRQEVAIPEGLPGSNLIHSFPPSLAISQTERDDV